MRWRPTLEDGELDTLRLLVSEVVTNAVRHGELGQPVELSAHWNAEVRDRGLRPRRRLHAAAAHRARSTNPAASASILVGRLADRWGVETDDGTTVWFVLQRH